MKKVFIAGAGMTKFGELWEQDLRSLMVAAAADALESSRLGIDEIDAIYVANMGGSSFAGQDHLGSLLATELGHYVPAYRIEAACASGGLAVNTAWHALSAGLYRNVLVVGAEKMSDVSGGDVTKGLARAADDEYEAYFGATFPSLYAMMARAYMHEHNADRSDLAAVSVKNHNHGSLNPKAQFPREITQEDVLNAAMVSDPLGLLDCSPVSDGAAAVVLSTKVTSVRIAASQVSTGSIRLHDRPSLTSIDATKRAAAAAYKQAGISVPDISLAEVHDCFSIAELIALEDLGFAKPGDASKLIKDGTVYRDGTVPVNTSGGLKACGHPVGATGVKQIVELYEQITGAAGKRQLKKDISFGLAHNVGGSGGTAVVTIVEHV
ncbi:MAG: 3-ketoacyl-CoA thiolase [candidate division WS6 bacterium OLB20]|uniref:3-ketoacyl-CoA thiolase n=1 Tax=candidate division WS6 bacterium OLB20 TaxID=1617426 RepID=A0A136M115_9BACT|nr:MAG: 3-ketoacyl-CoA thiolase [candidate division WS6 bacterium OLB20]